MRHREYAFRVLDALGAEYDPDPHISQWSAQLPEKYAPVIFMSNDARRLLRFSATGVRPEQWYVEEFSGLERSIRESLGLSNRRLDGPLSAHDEIYIPRIEVITADTSVPPERFSEAAGLLAAGHKRITERYLKRFLPKRGRPKRS